MEKPLIYFILYAAEAAEAPMLNAKVCAFFVKSRKLPALLARTFSGSVPFKT
jgi:hypothetical protein